jgi:fatty-acyl-CoA synthase
MDLWEALFAHPSERRGITSWEASPPRVVSWADLVADAHRRATVLRAHGVVPGTHVAGVMTNTIDAVGGLFAIWLCGGVFQSLPDQARGMSPSEYAQQIGGLVEHAGAELLLADDPFGHLTTHWQGPSVLRAWTWLAEEAPKTGPGVDGTPPEPTTPAFVQYSSGSTGRPKGCVLTPQAIAAQMEIILDLTGGEPGRDTFVTWIPASHDMGLFGCLIYPCAYGFDLFLSNPLRFVQAPRTWFADMAEHGATITAGTNTALSIATRAQRDSPLAQDLALTTAVIGAEPNDPGVFAAATATFGPSGLRPAMLTSAYGLAEATLAVACTRPGQAPTHKVVDRYALENHKIVAADPGSPEALDLASCGPPCAGIEVTAGRPGELATLRIASPSLATGYLADAELTRHHFRDGWLLTDDLGFVDDDGDVYVVGRADDVLVIGGRNLHAPTLEQAIGDAVGMRSSRVVLVDTPVDTGRRALVALIEPRDTDIDFRAAAWEASRAVTRHAGVELQHCFFLAQGALPKTPSGKTQRQRSRNLVRDGRIDTVADVALGAGTAGAPSHA